MCRFSYTPHAGQPNPLLIDASGSGRWRARFWAAHNADFREALRFTQACIFHSRAAETFSRYATHWRRFTAWCTRFRVPALPARPLHVAMFLAETFKYALAQGFSYSVVKAASAAIYQAHRLAGFRDSVTSHHLVAAVREAAKRHLGLRPKNRKDPISMDLCLKCALELSAPGCSLYDLQMATFIMVCFAGFLRYSDASNIFADEIKFYDTHMEVFIEKRKNLQYRQGEVVCIARGSSLACPVYLLEVYLQRTGLRGRHVPIFQQSFYNRTLRTYVWGMGIPWSYSQARRCTLQALARSANLSFTQLYRSTGLHSLRSGGATHVAARGVRDHIFQTHGGWASSQSMLRYISRPLANRLRPTRVMGY